jgi:hypothetical protein
MLFTDEAFVPLATNVPISCPRRPFLDNYRGAFHEALEAQSVTPRRLAGSLSEALRGEA